MQRDGLLPFSIIADESSALIWRNGFLLRYFRCDNFATKQKRNHMDPRINTPFLISGYESPDGYLVYDRFFGQWLNANC